MKEQIFRVYFVNPFSQKVGTLTFFMEFNLGIVALAYSISEIKMIQDNLPYVLLIMTVLSFFSLKNYLIHRSYIYYLSTIKDLKS